MTKQFKRIETQLIHAGDLQPRVYGAVETPIFQSSTFESGDESSYHDLKYIRLNNTPNHTSVGQTIAALEHAEAGLVTASGMAAISTTLFSILSAGDHILAQSSLYGGTHDLFTHDFARFGLTCDFIDADDPASWKAKVRPTTKAIYCEAMTNPLLEVADLTSIVRFAREHGLTSIIDNTFASPVNFVPIDAGFDIVLHSASKYLNGHSDIVAGTVAGKRDTVERIRHKLNHLGGSMDPHAAFLLSRGLKTLALRMRYQNESTLQIAKFLANHRAVARVNYAGLESHPRHARARELFKGFGGVLSFEVKGSVDATVKFMKATSIPMLGPSLGGVQTLMTRPAASSHAGLSAEERAKVGISDTLIRLSVGIEATEDLIEDFAAALATVS
jgi:cystathionine beta-lyase/cystathionine gamma-synthase